MNFPRLGDSFVASESFFFGFACGDFAHFLHHSFVHFINEVRTETPVESEGWGDGSNGSSLLWVD